MNIDWEFTARNALQQNHLAELGFTKIANGVQAMMHEANMPLKKCYQVIKETIQTETLLDTLDVVVIDGKEDARCKHWCGANPKFAKCLRRHC